MNATAKKAVSKVKPAAVQTAPTPLDMLNRAMDKGLDADQLDKFITLHERWEANEARKAFVRAMSEFKSTPLEIQRGRHVKYKNKTGGFTEYDHASLAGVVDAVVSQLGKHGLSHRWTTSQENGLVSVSCVIMHELGHSESTTLKASPDDSGGKNSIQAVGSTVTYLQRYTLMAATGLAAADMDNDAAVVTDNEPVITADQEKLITKLLKDSGKDRSLFLAYCKVETVGDIKAKNFDFIVKKLKADAEAQDNGA